MRYNLHGYENIKRVWYNSAYASVLMKVQMGIMTTVTNIVLTTFQGKEEGKCRFTMSATVIRQVGASNHR